MDRANSLLCNECSSLGLCRKDFELPAHIPTKANKLNQQRDPYMLQDGIEWELTRFTSSIEYAHVSRAVTKNQVGSALYPMLKLPLAGRFYGIQLIDDKHTSSLLRGRLVDEEPDIAMVRNWIKQCQTIHGESCKDTYLHIRERQRDLLVIDVETNCLAPLQEDLPYVSLSYVWGSANRTTTLKSNVHLFSQPNGLLKKGLPKTISNALEVTKALGYRYLWVDALCIVQDDDVSKKRMIESMDSVYGNSAITLVAATGEHADAGLSGWDKTCRKPPWEDVETIRSDFRIGLVSFFENEIEDSPYSRRSWTYQEEILSSRCLVFMNGRIFFYCRAALWREDLMAESEKIVFASRFSTGISRQWPEPLKRLSEHIFVYSSREMTYLSDIGRAFAGIHNAIAPLMNGSMFLQGIPTVAFDWALLWGAYPGHHIQRRPGFPSWSWMGHVGRIVMPESSSESPVLVQKWLREKTWINWYYASDGMVKPIWEINSRSGLPSAKASYAEEQTGNKRNVIRPKIQITTGDTDSLHSADGIGKLGELYGREKRHLPELGLTLPSSESHSLIPSIPHEYLDFMTFSCRYYLSQPLDPNRAEIYTSNCFVLKDSRLDTCGICHDDHNLFGSGWASEGQICEVILLSYALGQSRDLGAYRFARLNIPAMYRLLSPEEGFAENLILDDDEDTQWDSEDMLNVMLIRSSSEDLQVYERVAIGILHKRAVQNSLEPVCYRRVILH
ncbi:HET-domain-containing protein [Viridothelium virens]|uniref:HET-domain-containing protein n=1 Tax=Viridothelium virens TaxID=1048519 RepID=A0A6A6HR39_VIRVR|nr:HET-domain-containing protein [Viridothelium virens]